MLVCTGAKAVCHEASFNLRRLCRRCSYWFLLSQWNQRSPSSSLRPGPSTTWRRQKKQTWAPAYLNQLLPVLLNSLLNQQQEHSSLSSAWFSQLRMLLWYKAIFLLWKAKLHPRIPWIPCISPSFQPWLNCCVSERGQLWAQLSSLAFHFQRDNSVGSS